VEPGLLGIGYQGCTLDDLVASLLTSGVSRLVDVRLNPLSRKPGLSRNALARALADAGIAYEHRRELGNPKENRAGFAGTAAGRNAARARYRASLRRPEAREALDAVAAAATRERVAVLCFEAEQSRCHRDVVLHEVRRRLGTATGG
jgi:uncharacterized protein (DUF488 family)